MSDKTLSKTKVYKCLVDAFNELLMGVAHKYRFDIDYIEVNSVKDEKTGSTRIDIKINIPLED